MSKNRKTEALSNKAVTNVRNCEKRVIYVKAKQQTTLTYQLIINILKHKQFPKKTSMHIYFTFLFDFSAA